MHLMPGKATYRLRNVGIMQGAFFRSPNDPYYHVLYMVGVPRLLELRLNAAPVPPGAPTRPTHFAYCFERKTIELHPAPATYGELEVHYYPPLEKA